MFPRPAASALWCAAALLLSASTAADPPPPGADSLRAALAPYFRVGVAISTESLVRPEPDALALAARQFDSATPENLLKWENVHPDPDRYDFDPADRFVAFGQEHGMWLVGHALVWHQQTPEWVFHDASGALLSRGALLERMREHIRAVVGRYRGRIRGWDVVNEALADDGSLRDTPWLRAIGEDYIEQAFRFAHEADPEAELYYNDYSLYLPAKRDAAARLARRLRAAGVRIDALGAQAHWGLDYPSLAQLREEIRVLSAPTGKVNFTELDIDVLPRPSGAQGADLSVRGRLDPEWNPYTDGLPDEVQQRLASRYGSLFEVLLENAAVIDRVTFWGLDDGRTWHNGWPIPGRTAHSLLFDRRLEPKPAYDAVIRAAEAAGRRR